MTPDGDYRFGEGVGAWLSDSPATVAQAVQTRLALHTGEWFLDTAEGTPYLPMILGEHTESSRDWAISTRVLDTQGVSELTAYASQFSADTRAFSVQMTISTIYGTTTVQATL